MTLQVPIAGFEVAIDASYVDAPPETIVERIRAYEHGERRSFDLDVSYPDSFGGRVMRAMATIPYGETRSYGEIAADLGTSPIAVGGACGRNPVPIVVPCHRVVGADSLGGYSAGGEDGVELKRRLLSIEGVGAAIESAK